MNKKPFILLVEDNQDNKELLEYFLKQSNFTVISVTNGYDAIEVVKNHNIDLILLDMMLPRKSGFETAKELKSNPKFAHIPIIAVTALAMPKDRKKILEAGCDDYIAKPIDLYNFLNIINKWINDE